MKIVILLGLMMSGLDGAGPLKKHQWKHRVILIFGEDDLQQRFMRAKSALDERDLIYYQFTKKGVLSNQEVKFRLLSLAELKRVRVFYEKQGRVILIGKDGEVKKKSKRLDLKAIFDLVDTMPMRRREMQGRKRL